MRVEQPASNLRLEDLPAWMRPRRRVIDWGLLIVLVFCIPVVWSLLVRQGVPANTDAELYEIRSIEVARLVKSGLLFSRWAPDLHYGYGSPLFNYLAPLPHYLPGYQQALTDARPAESINLFLTLSIVAAASGMFLFVRQRWTTPAGLLASLVYIFSAPLSVTLPTVTGDLALIMALGLLPWALWAIDRLYLDPRTRSLVLAILFLTAFALCDARIAVLAIPIIAIMVITLRQRRGHYAYVARAIVVSTLLTAFFWLPALTERDLITWAATAGSARPGTISASEGLGVVAQVGSALWLLVVIGLSAIVVIRIWKRKSTPVSLSRGWLDALSFLALGLVYLISSTSLLQSLWPSPQDFHPLMPYHALLIAVFCLSVVAGQSALWLDLIGARERAIMFGALCLIPTLSSPGLTYRPVPLSSNSDYMNGLQLELRGNHIGSFRDGVLLPRTVSTLPSPPPNLVDDLVSGKFDRINRKFYSREYQINPVERNLLSDRYLFDIGRPGDIEFYILYFPGWSASIDNQRQEVRSSPEGFALVNSARLTGELVIWMEGTGWRYAAWLTTLTGGLLFYMFVRRVRAENERQPADVKVDWVPLTRREVIGLAVVFALYGAIWLSRL